MTDELADRVAAAIVAVPGVARMHSGTFGEVATYLPGRKVVGVRLRDDVTEVHVALVWGVDVMATADAVRAAVQPVTGTPVDVCVQDVLPEAGPEPATDVIPGVGAAAGPVVSTDASSVVSTDTRPARDTP